MKLSLLSLLLCFSFYSCSQDNNALQEKISATDQLFKKWDTENSPGATIGIIHHNKLIYSKGYGLANLEHAIPNRATTAFNVASNSKQFTAACISLLILQNKIRLAQTLSSFFPNLPSYAKNITIQHLLHHTSGLRDFSQITYLSGLRPDDFYTDIDILKWISAQQKLNFSPGKKHLYANSNYWLLGQIVQKVSGMTLAAFAKQELFLPLKMVNTQFYHDNTQIVKNRASGYSPSRSGGYRHIYSMLEHTGDGGIYTTVEDLKKWDDEFYKRKILKDDFWKLMLTQGELNNGEIISYANALIMDTHKGLKTIDHGGRAPGYKSNIIRFPDQEFTVIILSNLSTIDPDHIGYAIADIFLKDQLSATAPNPVNKIKAKKLQPKQLEKFVGDYWSNENAIARKIVFTNDTLQYERGRGRFHPLLPITTTEFKMLGTPEGMDVIVRFKTNKVKTSMIFIENGAIVDTWEQYQPVAYSPKELTAFIGKYYSTEIDTHYELRLDKNDRLLLFINGNPTVPLHPIKKQLFSSPISVFRFSTTVKGQVTSFTISTPRVKNLFFEKI